MQGVLDQLASAKTALARRNQELQEAEGAFTNAEVRSPVDGTVVGRKGEVGQPGSGSGQRNVPDRDPTFTRSKCRSMPRPQCAATASSGRPATVFVLDLQSSAIPADIKEIKDNRVSWSLTATCRPSAPACAPTFG